MLFGIQTAQATNYYVSAVGSDSNNGTSLLTPLKTIGNGLNKAKAFDTVFVLTGSYPEAVSVENNNITLSAYPNNKPVIDGTSVLKSSWGVVLDVSGNHNTISGFEVKNANYNGALVGGYGVEVNGNHNTLTFMNVHHSWETGLLLGGDYNTVEDSTIWQNARRNSTNTGQVTSGWATGMSAARNRSSEALKAGITSYATFRRNKVYNNWGEGLSCFEADYCTMEDNIVYDNWTINVYISDTSNSLIQRNLVYISSNPAIRTRGNGGNSTITLADELASKPRSAYNTITNNILFGGAFNAMQWTEVSGSGLNNVLIANNTLVNSIFATSNTKNVNSIIANNLLVNSTVSIPSNTGLSITNNSWNITGTYSVTQTGTTQAGLLKPEYFMLPAGSPMIGAGLSLAAVKGDYFKAVRKSNPDIGAHEFNGSTTPVEPPVVVTPPVTPVEPPVIVTPPVVEPPVVVTPPAVVKYVKITVSIPVTLRTKLNTYVKANGTTQSKTVESAVTQFLIGK